MAEYNKIQIKFIRCYARHLNISAEEAAHVWIKHGYAVTFHNLYHDKYYEGE